MKSPSEIEAIQNRFSELWKKAADGSATTAELTEMENLQLEYWKEMAPLATQVERLQKTVSALVSHLASYIGPVNAQRLLEMLLQE